MMNQIRWRAISCHFIWSPESIIELSHTLGQERNSRSSVRPLQELLLWTKHRHEVFGFVLSDLERSVEVVFVSDFLSQG